LEGGLSEEAVEIVGGEEFDGLAVAGGDAEGGGLDSWVV